MTKIRGKMSKYTSNSFRIDQKSVFGLIFLTTVPGNIFKKKIGL